MKQLLNNILNITIALRQQNQISQLNIRELTDHGRMTLFFKNTKGFWGSGASEGHRKIDPPKRNIKKATSSGRITGMIKNRFKK